MRLFLFLRSIVWTAVLAVVLAPLSILLALLSPSTLTPLPLVTGLASITFAILSGNTSTRN